MDDAMHGSPGDTVLPGDLSQALPAATILEDRLPVEIERPAADVPAFEACPPHAGTDPLDDQVAFQFRDRPDDHHDGPA